MEKVNRDLVYGFFTVETEDCMRVKRWHPAQNVGLTARQQFEHNQLIDPEFTILEIRELEVA